MFLLTDMRCYSRIQKKANESALRNEKRKETVMMEKKQLNQNFCVDYGEKKSGLMEDVKGKFGNGRRTAS
jgi:hypothetical protein